MNKTFKKVIIGLLVLVIVVVVGFFAARYYAYHGGKRDVQSETAAFTLNTKDILAEFTTNETAANKKYLEKPVALSGVISSMNEKEVILDEVAICNFTTTDLTLKVGQTVTVKGRVVGYDDLLGGVNLDQCSINK
jgi:predicted negative regulator of RcsB-dependent stress response